MSMSQGTGVYEYEGHVYGKAWQGFDAAIKVRFRADCALSNEALVAEIRKASGDLWEFSAYSLVERRRSHFRTDAEPESPMTDEATWLVIDVQACRQRTWAETFEAAKALERAILDEAE